MPSFDHELADDILRYQLSPGSMRFDRDIAKELERSLEIIRKALICMSELEPDIIRLERSQTGMIRMLGGYSTAQAIEKFLEDGGFTRRFQEAETLRKSKEWDAERKTEKKELEIKALKRGRAEMWWTRVLAIAALVISLIPYLERVWHQLFSMVKNG
jgi:hypothetical protein